MSRLTLRKLISCYFESPATRLLAYLGFTPNVVTGIGLIIATSGAYLISSGHLTTGGIAIILAGAFDMIDGSLARSTNRSTAFGAFIDSTADRISEIVVLFGLLIYYENATSTMGVILVYLALSGSFMVSYVRARAESIGVNDTTGIMTRPERVVILAMGLISSYWWEDAVLIALGIIFTLASLTTLQRVIGVRNNLN